MSSIKQSFTGLRALVVSPVPTHTSTHGNRARVLGMIEFLTSHWFDIRAAVQQREAERDEAVMKAVFGTRLHLLPPRSLHGVTPSLGVGCAG